MKPVLQIVYLNSYATLAHSKNGFENTPYIRVSALGREYATHLKMVN